MASRKYKSAGTFSADLHCPYHTAAALQIWTRATTHVCPTTVQTYKCSSAKNSRGLQQSKTHGTQAKARDTVPARIRARIAHLLLRSSASCSATGAPNIAGVIPPAGWGRQGSNDGQWAQMLAAERGWRHGAQPSRIAR